MDYIEVVFEIIPFSEEVAECIVAETADLGFESFVTEEPHVKAYVKKELYSQPHLKCVMDGFGQWDGVKISYKADLVPYQNWNAVWESSFEPIVIARRVTVKAPFHKVPLTKYNIRITPNMAFGTGHHQTTTLMLGALLSLNGEGEKDLSGFGWKSLRGRQVLDMGTGTGVLALLAAKMKAKKPVHAIDIDIKATDSANDNLRRNRLENAVHILCGDASLIQANKYDLILANINRNILLEDLSTYARGLRPGGVVAVSGFYTEDVPLLKAEALRQGLSVIHEACLEGWACILFGKPLL